jgi:serine/threonine-protein phosphatase PP1 catalytic subunit
MIDNSLLQKLIKKPEKIAKLNIDEISEILSQARTLIEKENFLLEFNLEKNEEAYVIGDIHGNLRSLMKLKEIIDKNHPKIVIFLGDIVDRGPNQVECLVYVLALKILKPHTFFILKGNHETLEMNQAYGFFYEFGQRFENYERFSEILAVYNVLPICALINESILCLHGGIPEDIDILNKLKGLNPKDVDQSTLESIAPGIFQIMWNDPKPGLGGFMRSYRGPGIKFFGQEAFNKFMAENNIKYLIRAHECFPEGYVWFFNYRLLSIFSSANYRGEFSPNPASYAIVKNNDIIAKNMDLSYD